jgi:predicted ribosome quality control (RQC) complex YloA/Tae2 family protein
VDNFYLSALVKELTPAVQGHTVARISLEGSTILFDLRLSSGRQLLASLDRRAPAVYLSNRISPRRSKGSPAITPLLRKYLVGAKLLKIWKEPADRIVRIDFETVDAGDNRIQVGLRLFLTGRSANCYMTGADGNVIGMLFDETPANRLARSNSSDAMPNPAELTRGLKESIAQSDVLDQYFGAGSLFSPQLRNEFLFRSQLTSAYKSFSSLIEDLFYRDPLPLVYAKLPLEQARQVVINPRTDLLLSHIELKQAKGMQSFHFESLSEAADEYYDARGSAVALHSAYAALKQSLSRDITRRESVLNAIAADRARFEQPEQLKRYGDLLLANIANAKVEGAVATVVDYYDPAQPEIQIEIPEGATLQAAASGYFTNYQKARRGLAAVAAREQQVSAKLVPLKELLLKVEHEPTADCIADVSKSLDELLGMTSANRSDKGSGARAKRGFAFGRRFKSTDGYEIVVGRNDRDNDALTFRVAKPHDIWLHAADYPGSHAIIRNPTRGALPHRTITEAAELAAFYSQAKREGKAAVHYAQKKFVSKPPRSKPGLVRLSSFKTILVEPRCNLERLG